MRRRFSVLSLVAACAVAVVTPSSAVAAGAQCSLVLPAKVVVDSRTEKIPYRLSSNCTANQAAFAMWDVQQAGGYGWSVDITRAEMAAGKTSGTLTYPDTGKRGLFRGYAYSSRQADGDRLTQNMPLMQAKTACRVSLTGSRSTLSGWKGYTISVEGTIWSSATHRWANRRGGTVELLKRRDDGSWALAGRSTLTTSGSGGSAVFFPKGSKKGDKFRVVVKETATAWSCGSAPHTVRS
jgi:hypothetical protein